ncbi:MAG: putative RDD family membrane protein YckC [Planctomycetota bacterium]|jgi:uncharacterized RDD family membrane protein YckC
MAPPSSQAPEENNPYAAPVAEVQRPSDATQLELASLPERFFGNLLDNFMMAPMAVFILAFSTANEETGMVTENTMSIAVGLLMALLMVNFILLMRNGQTLGKLILRTRIVTKNGGRAGFGALIVRRSMLNGFLVAYVPVYFFLDALLIFRRDRRCLHDHLAGTVVIKA